eukprot:CAMPEP_0184338292 /NCGR_PEP_ID=MMETSP1089-20130417/6819_1 /TAXON_ID=38269 ORGANISM="Gloeochaete wittrockiana, Strain SAG46.84" /NCGR_SAMPLE_ID=MMETSP1089 /ASSEMBLY_ACC=CAM_ASM_000445 /LENGTH=260 /DNA_ID=CAMNT_0026664707 /DNA_START=194 /DNA_END=973 /DNA_ORIENTATION=-
MDYLPLQECLPELFIARCREVAKVALSEGLLSYDDFDSYSPAVILGIPACVLADSIQMSLSAPGLALGAPRDVCPSVSSDNCPAQFSDIIESLESSKDLFKCAALTREERVVLRKMLLNASVHEGLEGSPLSPLSPSHPKQSVLERLVGAVTSVAARISQRAEYKRNYNEFVVKPFSSNGKLGSNRSSPALSSSTTSIASINDQSDDDTCLNVVVNVLVKVVAIFFTFWFVLGLLCFVSWVISVYWGVLVVKRCLVRTVW